MSDDNVRSYRRKKLEPEVAAVSFRTADETPVIVINVDERRTAALAALKKLRPHVLIPLVPALFVAAAERLIRKMREHSKTTILIGATATAASAIAVSPISIKWDTGDQLSKPPAALRVVTQPAVTHTLTVPATPTRSTPAARQSAPPERVTPSGTGQPPPQPAATRPPSSPAARPSRPPTASSRPSSRPSARPTSRSSSQPPPRPSTAPRGDQDTEPRSTSAPSPRPETSARQEPPSARPTQAPTSAPSTAPPETTAGPGNCTIRVDLDPLLDLCVLG